MLTFKELGLSPDLQKGIDDLGFEIPTPIQEKVIPLVLQTEKDIVGLAQTGTGKTAAFGLPIINQLNLGDANVQALILSPTRELCIQIANDLKGYSKHMQGVRIVPVYGGASIEAQIRDLRRGAHIIAATPGRILDLLKRKVAKIENIKTVVLDEADEMLNMGFREDLDKILESTPDEKRTLLFSATMPNDVARIAKNYMQDPEKVTIGTQNAGAENVRHIFYQVHARDRYLALKRIADINPNIYGIVFCRTRAETKDVADKLIKDGYNADALHGDLSQAQRDYVMKRFRERTIQMLVATDVAARGIDVDDISHVVNYNLPDELPVYTHRSGRTGRANKSGICISILNYREKSRVPQIERLIKKKMEKMDIPSGRQICNKQLFNIIDRMERVEVDEEQIAPFMDAVNKKLEWLSKEEIVKRFLSLEFNRFLEYYKNAPDLNAKAESGISRRDSDRGGRSQGRGFVRRKGGGDYSRFFINIGKKDRIDPKGIIGMINDFTRDRDIAVGSIDILDNFSFFEVDSASTEKIINSFAGRKHNGRSVSVEPAEEKKSKSDRGGRGKFKKDRKPFSDKGDRFKKEKKSGKKKSGKKLY